MALIFQTRGRGATTIGLADSRRCGRSHRRWLTTALLRVRVGRGTSVLGRRWLLGLLVQCAGTCLGASRRSTYVLSAGRAYPRVGAAGL